MSDDLTPLPPPGMPRGTPANAREIARGLKWLSDNFAEASDAEPREPSVARKQMVAGLGGHSRGRQGRR
jgi:hypothetical protein